MLAGGGWGTRHFVVVSKVVRALNKVDGAAFLDMPLGVLLDAQGTAGHFPGRAIMW